MEFCSGRGFLACQGSYNLREIPDGTRSQGNATQFHREGAVMKKHTVCRLCSSCCPVAVEIEGNRLVAAERMSFLPPEQKWPCPKLKAAADIVYSPARLKRPLIRKKTGSVHDFRETSWEEALEVVVERFKYFKAALSQWAGCGAWQRTVVHRGITLTA
jgi:anaerobic selenocysteine-containing dehydrogenase